MKHVDLVFYISPKATLFRSAAPCGMGTSDIFSLDQNTARYAKNVCIEFRFLNYLTMQPKKEETSLPQIHGHPQGSGVEGG
jgi:hypothetical protein